MYELKSSYLFFFAVWFTTIVFRLFELRLAKQNLAKRKSEPNLQIAKEPFFFLFVILHSSFLIIVPIEILVFNRKIIACRKIGFVSGCAYENSMS